jgi:alpha-glucosidase (family GH31 glycosyl hydrolase)
MIFAEDGWVSARDPSKKDVYLFAYGLGRFLDGWTAPQLSSPADYRAALKAFYMVSGKTPLIPRWALGNWWSRYCK